MGGGRFEANPRMKNILMAAVLPEMKRKAGAGLEYARRVAPRSDIDHEHYADNLELVEAVWPQDNVRGFRILATVSHAIDVEYGSRNTPGHRVLGRAADVIKGA